MVQKSYRINEIYVNKLDEIKSRLQKKDEYSSSKLNDTDVFKYMIDYTLSTLQGESVSDDKVNSFAEKIIQSLNPRLEDNSKLFNDAITHFEKTALLNKILLDNLLRLMDVDENMNYDLSFAKFAERIIDDEK